jgi:hypothetical protein
MRAPSDLASGNCPFKSFRSLRFRRLWLVIQTASMTPMHLLRRRLKGEKGFSAASQASAVEGMKFSDEQGKKFLPGSDHQPKAFESASRPFQHFGGAR